MFRVSDLEIRICVLSGGRSYVCAPGRGFFDFSGLQTAHADIDAAYRSIQKENFHFLNVREETAARNTGDLFTDTASLFRETATHDRVAR